MGRTITRWHSVADISFEIRGLGTTADAITALVEADRKVIRRALYVGGEKVVARAKELVPVDEGILRGTGHVALPGLAGDLVVQPTFGGPAAPYALVQHERMDFHHTTGQAKYLETAMHELAPAIVQEVTDQIEAFHQSYARASLPASQRNSAAPLANPGPTPTERFLNRQMASEARSARRRARGARR